MTEARKKPDLRAARAQRGPTRINEWVLHPDLGVLRSDSAEVRLNPKSLHVLLVLLDAGDKGVSRDHLLDEVWGENYPSDNVISRAMADLRAAFGEKAGEQKYIRTLPKYGYQFVATHAAADTAEPRPVPEQRATHLRRYRHHYLLGAVLLVVVFLLPKVLKTPQAPETAAIVLSGSRPLTSAPGLEHQPRIVPGTDWVVHAVMRRDRDDWDLFRVSTIDGALQPVAVTPNVHEHGPAISPLGDELAYVRLGPEGCDVVIQSIALGVPEPIATCTQKFPTLVDWSPVNNQLAFTIAQRDEPDSRRRIYTVDRNSGESRRMTDAVSPTGTDFYPRYSPSGDRIAFLRGEPQPDHRTTLWMVDVESGIETRLTDIPAQLGGMAWISESRLLFSESVAGPMRGKIIDVTSGISFPLESPEFMHPEYAAGKGMLVTAEPRSDQDLVLLDKTGTTRSIGQSTSDDHHGSLSPDEKWIAFVSRRSGFDELWLAATEGDAVRRLTRFDGAAVRYPDWHPAGQRILITAQSDIGERLYVVDIVSGAATLIDTEFDVTTPRWQPDGNSWVAGCHADSTWQICIGDTSVRQFFAEGFYRPRPSGDSIYVVNDAGVLFEISEKGTPPRPVWSGLPARGRYGWIVEDGTLYFLAGGIVGNAGRLMTRDLESGELQTLYQGNLPVADATLSVGRQTGDVLLTVFLTSSDDLVVYDTVSFD